MILREASSLVLLAKLIKSGAIVQAYDPAAMPAAKKVLPNTWFDEGKLIL